VRWSPDGKQLAFVSFEGKYPQLFVVPTEGTEVAGQVDLLHRQLRNQVEWLERLLHQVFESGISSVGVFERRLDLFFEREELRLQLFIAERFYFGFARIDGSDGGARPELRMVTTAFCKDV